MIYTNNYCRREHRHLHRHDHKNTISFVLLAVLHHHDTVYLALNQNLIEAITARYVVKYPIQKALRSDYHLIDIPRPI